MIDYKQALQILQTNSFGHISSNSNRLKTQLLPLQEARGQFLAQEIRADRDFPPFDRVRMDGIAINSQTFQSDNEKNYWIQEVAAAGTPQCSLQDSKNCIEVMTGAIVPQGTDAIVPYEDLEVIDGRAIIKSSSVHSRQNIHNQGSDIHKDKVLLHSGTRIGAVVSSILAAVGKSYVQTYKLPRAVLISTGDELVSVESQPKVFQIRRSNAYALQSKLQSWNIDTDLRHVADDRKQMLTVIAELLEEYDVLIFTGGVSKGKYDFLPQVLQDLKIQRLFHKIAQRPGKPLWFGISEQGNTIFGLPGNPVSSMVCLCVYFRHWLFSSPEFLVSPQHDFYSVVLTNDVHFNPDLTFFLEGKVISSSNATLKVEARPGNGSGDFINLVNSDGFLILPRDRSVFYKGEIYPFLYYMEQD